MKIQQFLRSIDYFFLISTFVVLALGSIGIERGTVIWIGIAITVAAIGNKLIQNGSVAIPKYFYLYALFVATLLVHTVLTKGDISFFWMFLSGGFFWLEVFNYKDLFSKYWAYFLVALGALMGILYFYSLYSPVGIPDLVSLFSPGSELIKHSGIGDLWAVVLVVAFYLYQKNRSVILLPIILVGLYFVTVSFSRTALVSVVTGILFIQIKSGFSGKFKKELAICFAVLIGIFLYMGVFKTVIFSRPYFFQALASFPKFPFGTGIGNFTLISYDSNLVHNIVLEVFSGLGIFSMIFIAWIYLEIKMLFKKESLNILAAAIFIAVFTNFCFNATYVIPAFVWIWFISLGLV